MIREIRTDPGRAERQDIPDNMQSDNIRSDVRRKQVAVIGAGAAGLMAACAAADAGASVIILEKTEKAGKKIYITGKGRCNLTNACDIQEFWTHIVSNPKFLYSAVYGFDAQQRNFGFKGVTTDINTKYKRLCF